MKPVYICYNSWNRSKLLTFDVTERSYKPENIRMKIRKRYISHPKQRQIPTEPRKDSSNPKITKRGVVSQTERKRSGRQ